MHCNPSWSLHPHTHSSGQFFQWKPLRLDTIEETPLHFTGVITYGTCFRFGEGTCLIHSFIASDLPRNGCSINMYPRTECRKEEHTVTGRQTAWKADFGSQLSSLPEAVGGQPGLSGTLGESFPTELQPKPRVNIRTGINVYYWTHRCKNVCSWRGVLKIASVPAILLAVVQFYSFATSQNVPEYIRGPASRGPWHSPWRPVAIPNNTERFPDLVVST